MMGIVNDRLGRMLLVFGSVATALAIAVAITRFVQTRPGRSATPALSIAVAAGRPLLSHPPERPFLMFISLASDDTFKHVVLAPLDAPDGARYVTPLDCERVYYSGSRGVCLETRPGAPGVATHLAHVFDEHFSRLRTLTLTGPPSRTRLSPDGRRAAFTVFDEGHSYADGIFSTRTTLVDTIAGTVIGDLETWKITRDGKPFANRDFNFWGVTFGADGHRFYATLRTQGRVYLIEGDVDNREARVVLQGAECPSLSPDQARIAFKKRLGGSEGWWQLAVLDLSTSAVRVLGGDTESVDDQVEWLDAGNLIYFRPSDKGNIIWRLGTDTNEPPQPFVRDGFSPAVVR